MIQLTVFHIWYRDRALGDVCADDDFAVALGCRLVNFVLQVLAKVRMQHENQEASSKQKAARINLNHSKANQQNHAGLYLSSGIVERSSLWILRISSMPKDDADTLKVHGQKWLIFSLPGPTWSKYEYGMAFRKAMFT